MNLEEHSSASKDCQFLYIPISRLVIMSILTGGLYQAYWMYKNWKYIKERDKMDIKPFWLSVFGIFFIHKLFKIIQDSLTNTTFFADYYSAEPLATVWVVLNVLGSILSRSNDVFINIIGGLLSMFTFLILESVQKYINILNQSIEPKPKYHKWSIGHFVCLFLGLLIWSLSIYGIAFTVKS